MKELCDKFEEQNNNDNNNKWNVEDIQYLGHVLSVIS